MGAYYTPPLAAVTMARWLLANGARSVLEPSMGDGAFLNAVESAAQIGGVDVDIWGSELASDTFQEVVSAGLVRAEQAFCGDFLALEPFPVDGVIGNPPYVRLRHLPPIEGRRALDAANDVLGFPMDPGASIWMPFVLHATRFLRAGGCLAFVLPYEFTYVRYARPLWNFLRNHFRDIRIARVHERVFPEIMQDVVLFFAAGFGGATSDVRFEAFERVSDLVDARPAVATRISVSRVIGGERPFVESLLPGDLLQLLEGALGERLTPARNLVRFNIGYVSGDKTFFHPESSTVQEFSLPSDHLMPALTSSRQLRGLGIRTSAIPDPRSFLYLPNKVPLSADERRYIEFGERSGVSQRFKCRIRDPWFVTPGVRVPDLVLPVFADAPLMVMNDASWVVSNSLLCGYVKEGVSAASVIARWYTSLTLLQAEIEVHALGGGVRVFVPNEAGAIRLPMEAVETLPLMKHLHDSIRSGRTAQAFEHGDAAVLVGQMGLRNEYVELIREGVEILAHWRNSAKTSRRSAA
ncbi:MAG TPA: hypothetical protein VFB25_11180 [Gaiellaceae bacterium]|nr:hypothetical protein [Gaiellaceae bacterium]